MVLLRLLIVLLLLVLVLTTMMFFKGCELLEFLVFLLTVVSLVLVLLRVEDFVEVLHDLDGGVAHFVRDLGRRVRVCG